MALKKCKCEKSPSPWELVKQKKNKNDVIRVGDYVEILKPETFVRCGYNLTTDEILEHHITPEQHKLLDALLLSVGYSDKSSIFLNKKEDRNYNDLEKAFARIVLRSKLWGGRERKVHTKFEPEFLNAVGKVISKRYVKTGLYHSGGPVGYSYYGEDYDYEPPYLENENTIIIYDIQVGSYFNFKEFPEYSIVKITKEDYNEIIDKNSILRFDTLTFQFKP